MRGGGKQQKSSCLELNRGGFLLSNLERCSGRVHFSTLSKMPMLL